MKQKRLAPFSFLQKGFHFILFTSLFIAVCAVLMCIQTYYLFNVKLNYNFLFFVLAGTLCSYNFHWYFTPFSGSTSVKNTWSANNKKLHLFIFLIALLFAAYFFFLLRHYWLWLLSAAFFTFLYSAPKISFGIFKKLRKIAVGKTIFLAFAWMHITCFLPLAIAEVELETVHYIFIFHKFFFLYAICIIFDLRDRESDMKEGIISMITTFNISSIDILFQGSVFVSFISLVFLYFFGFSITSLIAFFIPLAIVTLLYKSSKNSNSDYLFYFILDGLMMFSFLLLLVFGF